MNKKAQKSMAPPPARPVFNRENTKFISLAEMQKQDPSLIPKKETPPPRLVWIGSSAILILAVSLTVMKNQNISHQDLHTVSQNKVEIRTDEKNKLVSQKLLAKKELLRKEVPQSSPVEVEPSREPAARDDEEEEEELEETHFLKRDYPEHFNEMDY